MSTPLSLSQRAEEITAALAKHADYFDGALAGPEAFGANKPLPAHLMGGNPYEQYAPASPAAMAPVSDSEIAGAGTGLPKTIGEKYNPFSAAGRDAILDGIANTDAMKGISRFADNYSEFARGNPAATAVLNLPGAVSHATDPRNKDNAINTFIHGISRDPHITPEQYAAQMKDYREQANGGAAAPAPAAQAEQPAGGHKFDPSMLSYGLGGAGAGALLGATLSGKGKRGRGALIGAGLGGGAGLLANYLASQKKTAGAIDPALIAPLVGATAGGAIGAMGSRKNKLQNALLGAGIGGVAGGIGEYALPGLGLGAKYTAQDIGAFLKSKVMGKPDTMEQIGRAGSALGRVAELGEYGIRRRSILPGMFASYVPGWFGNKNPIDHAAENLHKTVADGATKAYETAKGTVQKKVDEYVPKDVQEGVSQGAQKATKAVGGAMKWLTGKKGSVNKAAEESADAYYDKQPEKMRTYEAGESVNNMPIKQVEESHKKCTPGEFGMHKEGTALSFGQKLASGWQAFQPPPPGVPYGIRTNPVRTENGQRVVGPGNPVDAKNWKPAQPPMKAIPQQPPQQPALKKMMEQTALPLQKRAEELKKRASFGANALNDYATYGGTGAGIGALIGALGSEKGRLLSGTARGALVGGGIGLGNAAGRRLALGGVKGLTHLDSVDGKLDPRTVNVLHPLATALAGGAGGLVGGSLVDRGIEEYDHHTKEKKKEKNAFEKAAIPSFGGRNFSLAPRGSGVGLNAGYDYLAGLIPNPYVGIDIGTPHTGVSLSGPIPGIGFRSGMFTRPPGASSGFNRSNAFGHRSFWKYLTDGDRDPKDIEDEVHEDRLQSMRNVTKDEFHEAIPEYHTGPKGKPLSKDLHKALTEYYHEHSRPKKEKRSAMAGGVLGALGGLMTSDPGQRGEAVGRGALIGAGTELGMYPGAATGSLIGAGLGGLVGGKAGLGLGALAGGTLGGVGGATLGNMGARGLLGEYKRKAKPVADKKPESEETQEPAEDKTDNK